MARGDLRRLAIAQDRVSDAVLRAPIDGHVQSRLIELHEYVQPRVPVLALVAIDSVKIRATVPDRFAHLLSRGAPAEVWVNTDASRVYPGTISLIGVSADRETRAIPFEVIVDNPTLALKPDTVASVRIVAGAPPQGVLVPISAVLRDIGLQPFCFVVEDATGRSVL